METIGLSITLTPVAGLLTTSFFTEVHSIHHLIATAIVAVSKSLSLVLLVGCEVADEAAHTSLVLSLREGGRLVSLLPVIVLELVMVG